MNRSTLRAAIIVLTLVTAAIHLIVLNARMGRIDPAFTLNGIGYLGLLAALFFVKLSFLEGRETLLHSAYMGFTVLTIAAYFAINQNAFGDLVGLFTQVDQILLLIALGLHLRAA